MTNREHFNHLANLFRYPDDNYKKNVVACGEYLKKNHPLAFESYSPFLKFIEDHDFHRIEEVFGKTFHIQAICFLDLGYVLFAEDYKRGEFLVRMKDEQRRVNNDCGMELADNLPNVLTWMAKCEDPLFLKEFGVRIMIVSLEKMLEEFEQARMELKDKVRKKKQKVILMEDMENKHIYKFAIQAALDVMKENFKGISYGDSVIKPTLGGNFLKSCGTGCSTTPQTVKTVQL